MKLKMICSKCGSEDVKLNAWTRWNKNTQEWEFQGFEDGFCETCEGEADVESAPDNFDAVRAKKEATE